MMRVCSAFAATLIGAGLLASPVSAQEPAAPQAPTMTPILGGKSFVPPLRGQADVDFVRPETKRQKDLVVTRVKVKNTSAGPIARLTIAETWYGKDGAVVTGSKGFINGLLKPGEIQTIEIQTPYDPKMTSNNFNFSHANGTVRPHQVKTLDDPKEAAAKPAPAPKK